MKTRILCFGLALALAVVLFGCGKTEPEPNTTVSDVTHTESEPQTVGSPESESQTEPQTSIEPSRTLAYYTGIYGAGRCTVRIEALRENEAQVHITWGDSAFEMYEWEMTGFFDPDTYCLTYSDCVKTDVVYAADGSETRTVFYENGVGRFRFSPDHSMIWQDEEDDAGADVEFMYSP